MSNIRCRWVQLIEYDDDGVTDREKTNQRKKIIDERIVEEVSHKQIEHI